MRVVKGDRVVDDPWQVVRDEGPLAPGDVIVPARRWVSERAMIRARSGRCGVLLEPDDEADQIAGDLGHLDIIALDFPRFTDGRNYSNARLLRDRHGYDGELRAVGEVLRDQVYYMARCGIDSFELVPGTDPQEILAGLADFSVVYQAASDGRTPVGKLRA